MEIKNFLEEVKNREDFRRWLSLNCEKEEQCFVQIKMGEPKQDGNLYYLDAVEEALCFGWIDSVTKKDAEQRLLQRFSKRRKNSNWTELNKQRARRLIKLGKMSEFGFKTLPNLEEEFKIEEGLIKIFEKDEKLMSAIKNLPELYLKIRVDNILKVKKDERLFKLRLNKFIVNTKKGKFYGAWNDYGRLA